MIIKDEIHGHIEIDDYEMRMVDTEEFQRLRGIRQMAFTYLVYPGSNHTRFEHSLGVMHVASSICDKLGFGKEEKEKARLYALLHDVGHMAYSHESEKVLKDYLGPHEKVGAEKILKGEIGDILNENYGKNGAKMILGLEEKLEGKVVSSDLGADRMDYLVRDAQNTGVAYGIIDIGRIMHTLEMRKGELMITEGGLEAAESLLVARFMMFSTVYLHKTVRIAAAMFQRGMSNAIEDGELDAADFLNLGDWETLELLRGTDNGADYANRLAKRRLYKEAYSVDSEGFRRIKDRAGELETAIAAKAGCEVILEYPTGFFKQVDFKVIRGDGAKPISEISDLVQALKASEEKRRRLLVLCPEEKRALVAKIAKKMMG